MYGGDDSFTSDDNSQIELSASNLLFSIEKILFFANIGAGDQVVFINSSPNNIDDNDNLLEFHQYQQLNEIKTIRNSYNVKWIPYQQWTSRTTNRKTYDDHTMSSIERI